MFDDVPNDLGQGRGLHVFGKLDIEIFLNRHEKLNDFQGAQTKIIETGTGRKQWPKPPLGELGLKPANQVATPRADGIACWR